ncbi:DUF5325 family protein [Aureibacillus halotolerans]|uniref:Uncharacterized protein n=1 Tax=Aureibacillus halotolerans TaxID=1508390 RepID=A0A4R6U7F0_9BACI|nr:DUF5325 family protein [Aureibacillus halotolerans]TDQ42271.1 hypothetical protein EV213_102302 [Aureibacillus halotolerans]
MEMKEIKWKYLLLAVLCAFFISLIGVAIGLKSWLLGIIATLCIVACMGVGFSQKAKDRIAGKI